MDGWWRVGYASFFVLFAFDDTPHLLFYAVVLCGYEFQIKMQHLFLFECLT